MAAKIGIGDTIRIYDKVVDTFRRHYANLPATFVVKGEDNVFGKRRLYVDGHPEAIWAMHARIVRRAGK